MDVKPDLLYLENKTALTLNNRFSELLMEHLTKRRVQLKGRQKSMVLRLRNIPRSQVQTRYRSRFQGAVQKGSVWTRIGWGYLWRRGVWNFRNKYRRRFDFNTHARFNTRSEVSPAHSGRFVMVPKSGFSRFTSIRAGLSGVQRKRRILEQTPQPFKGAGVSAVLNMKRLQGQTQKLSKGTSIYSRLKKTPPTKKQLDSELDQYMSKTKSRLDQQLEEYMSLSRTRLDRELDEYMAMAGQTSWFSRCSP